MGHTILKFTFLLKLSFRKFGHEKLRYYYICLWYRTTGLSNPLWTHLILKSSACLFFQLPFNSLLSILHLFLLFSILLLRDCYNHPECQLNSQLFATLNFLSPFFSPVSENLLIGCSGAHLGPSAPQGPVKDSYHRYTTHKVATNLRLY